jgi:hypothetical protein
MFSSSLLSTWIRGNCRLHNTHFTSHDDTLFLLLHFYVFYREAPPPSPATLCRNFPFFAKTEFIGDERPKLCRVSGLHLPSLLIYLFVQDEELLLYEDGKVVFTPSPPPFLPLSPPPSPPPSPFLPPPTFYGTKPRKARPVWRQISYALERGIIIEELFF